MPFLEMTAVIVFFCKILSYLCECHFGDDGQHDFLAFGRIWVFLVFVEPLLQSGRRLPSGVLPPRRQVVPASIPEVKNTQHGQHKIVQQLFF